jgi:hypothetical protein
VSIWLVPPSLIHDSLFSLLPPSLLPLSSHFPSKCHHSHFPVFSSLIFNLLFTLLSAFGLFHPFLHSSLSLSLPPSLSIVSSNGPPCCSCPNLSCRLTSQLYSLPNPCSAISRLPPTLSHPSPSLSFFLFSLLPSLQVCPLAMSSVPFPLDLEGSQQRILWTTSVPVTSAGPMLGRSRAESMLHISSLLTSTAQTGVHTVQAPNNFHQDKAIQGFINLISALITFLSLLADTTST